MRIIVDMQGAQTESRFRGIGRYTMSLVQAIVRNQGEHEIILTLNGLFSDTIEPIRSAFDGLLPQENIHVWYAPAPVLGRKPGNEWRREVAEYIREDFLASLKPDLVLVTSLFEGYVDDAITSISLYSPQIPTAVILYDLIPLLNPETYLKSDLVYAQYYQRKIEFLKKATLWLGISESAAREGREVLSLPPDKIVNISAACTPIFKPVEITDAIKQQFLARPGISQPFILYSGGSDDRKNLRRLIRAYARLPKLLRETYQLVMAGKMPNGDVIELKQIAKTLGISSKNLLFTDYVSDEELAWLYNLCTVFILPSIHEGFGLPALEAMSCGAAVIGANTTSIPELIDRQDALFDPYDETSISQKLIQVIDDPIFRNELISHGLEQAKQFSWDKSAKRAIAAFERINEHKQHAPDIVSNWSEITSQRTEQYQNLIQAISNLSKYKVLPTDNDLKITATCIANNDLLIDRLVRAKKLPDTINWRIEGPFDSSYSLALVNRETARAIEALGHKAILHSTEGPGDFLPSNDFLHLNPDLAKLYQRSKKISSLEADISSRDLYPPRVADMNCRLNFLHNYGWEESAFPQDWIKNFNDYLQGITCLSNHVEKTMIDNGVTVPLSVSGIGVDHWTRIKSDKIFQVKGKSFRFLHVSSCFPRKGADILLKAYGQAFTADDDVTLIIKTFPNPHNDIHRWLAECRTEWDNYPHITIIEDDLSDEQLKALYEQCHVLVAPSRAEGFGLPMAEAMLSGLAVITTGWSGQVDFCNEQTSWLIDYTFEPAQTHFDLFDSVWATPHSDHLAQLMREVHETPIEIRDKRTQKGKQLLLEKFKWVDTAEHLVEAARSWALIPPLPEPRIGWITSWNTKCGIATYSAHLVENIPANMSIFAAKTTVLTHLDDSRVFRCWETGEDDTLEQLAKQINDQKIETLVIQFNYGFFNLENFAHFIDNQLDAGRIIVVAMHSTCDPINAPHKRLENIKTTLSRCHRILLHTPEDLNRLKKLGLIDNVTLFPHGIRDFDTHSNAIPTPKKDRITIASYGFFLPHKGLLELIDTLNLLHKNKQNIYLKMINAEYPVPESAALITKAKKKIAELNLEKHIHLNTEFLTDDECLTLLTDADLIVFPYQITGESSSAAVRSGLATARPVAVTPLSIFDDVKAATYTLPGYSPQDMAQGIEEILREIRNKNDTFRIKQSAATHWREAHRYTYLGHRLYNMLQALARKHI